MESVGELALDLVLKGGKPLPLGEQTTSTLTQESNPGKSRDYQSPRYLSRLFAGAAELRGRRRHALLSTPLRWQAP